MTTPLSLHIGDLPPMAKVRALPYPARGRKQASAERRVAANVRAEVRPMSDVMQLSPRQRLEKSRREKTIEFRLIFAAAFLVFLFTAAISRLSPQRLLSSYQVSAPQKSILLEAKEAASISAVYAFMG